MRRFQSAGVALAAFVLSPGVAAGEMPPEKIDVSGLPGELFGEVVIPVPQEIFKSLDKLGARDWRKHLRTGSVKIPAGRAEQALLFGLVIANGFIAVEVEDAEAVRDVGRDVLNLAKALGVQRSVIAHSQSIIDSADRDQWMAVRRELDRTQTTVKRTMKEMRDDDLAELVSVGGWLGGTEALSGTLELDYDRDGSELLHQPDLLSRLTARYLKIPESLRRGPVQEQTGSTLLRLGPLMAARDGVGVPKEDVASIHKMTDALVAAVYEVKR